MTGKTFPFQSTNQAYDITQKEQITKTSQCNSYDRVLQQPLLVFANEIDCIAIKTIFKVNRHPSDIIAQSKIPTPAAKLLKGCSG